MGTDWTSRAACVGRGDLMTAADTPERLREAKALCADCPVWSDCLDALAAIPGTTTATEMAGIVAGGLTGERLAVELRRRAPKGPKPIRHGTLAGQRTHYRRGEKPCEACRIGAAVAKNPDAFATRQRWAS